MNPHNTINPKLNYATRGCQQPMMAQLNKLACAEMKRIQQLEVLSRTASARQLMLHGIAQGKQDILSTG
ncbi:hypothetical protein LG409_12975 [Halomonas sp. NyZ770]|uniref:hypothetical protein n=1 Tax=Halomonas sp. NyZ770 TaxID=2883106 RepID=UPI001D0A3582|nr:hypothetical protein [Halomonas sp. NyZ770]UDM06290.1 hypothetical protein LG409_12975 [Halomonas sp. NyZ770]